MFTLKIQPENGQIYELTHNYGEFIITCVSGLEPPKSTINITSGSHDGGLFNSARMETRNIVITCVLNGDIAASRQKLYRIFPPKSPVTVFFKSQGRDMQTVGYVEQPASDPFSLRETAQISLICPDPYWHGVDETTASFSANQVVTIDNTGDAPVGFQCVLRFTSDNPPSVTLAESSATLSAAFPYQRNLMLYPVLNGEPVADSFDASTQRIVDLTVGGVDYTQQISSVEKIVKQDDISGTNATTYIHVLMTSNLFSKGNYSIGYTIASVIGGSMETVECKTYESTTFLYNGVWFYDLRYGENYLKTKDFYKVYLYNGTAWTDATHLCTLTNETSTPPFVIAQFNFDLYAAGYKKGKIVIYHDTNNADIRNAIELNSFGSTRNPSVEWYSNLYTLIPAGFNPAKDIPYINNERITDADMSSCYIVSGGNTTQYSIIYGDPSASVDFRYVYSLYGEDVRTYDDDQIVAGLLGTDFTKGVVLWNNSTGEWMQFKSTRFQLGDVVEISTVPDDLYARIIRRNHQDVNISLLYDVYKNGYFFTLQQGENQLELTAQSGASYVSGELSAGVIYVGV